jgi:NAD(P)-dependent dehydrogenase (short-subunit alcohol dehydrogenase family)
MKKSLLSRALFVGLGAAALTRFTRSRRMYSFSGKVVVITGGSRGLGLVLARQWVARGARVVLLARDEAELRRAEADLKARGGNALGIPCDVTDRRQIEDAIRQAALHFGGLDVVVNNAGMIQVGPLEHMKAHDFEEAMAVHFFGPLHAILAALPYMKQRGGGRIVNIASIGGKRNAHGKNLCNDGLSRVDADRFATECPIQRQPSPGICMVCHYRQLAGAFDERRTRRRQNH